VAEKLRRAGFTVVGTGNAPETTDTTTVAHPDGLTEKAKVLASRLPDTRATRSADAAAGEVTLIVGSDLDPEKIR
jgi:hypothetical protein